MKTIFEPVGTTETRANYPPSRDASAEQDPPAIHLRNILVPTDLSEMSLKSLQYAVPFAKLFGAKITLLHVVEPTAYTPELPYPAALGADHLAVLASRLAEISAGHIDCEIPVDKVVRHGFAFENIMDVARDTRTDLIITTTHGYSGLKHALMGSIAESIARSAPCPVLVIRETEHEFV
jgi:nucleotide-binding universal stress UspA family protein